jgi:hypothetical protein
MLTPRHYWLYFHIPSGLMRFCLSCLQFKCKYGDYVMPDLLRGVNLLLWSYNCLFTE